MNGKQLIGCRIVLLLFSLQLLSAEHLFAWKSIPIPKELQPYVSGLASNLAEVEAQVDFKKVKASCYYVTLQWEFDQTVSREDVQFQLTPAFQPTFHWAPHLTPTDEHVVAQHVFRSPAMILHDEERWLTLIPDVSMLQTEPQVPWYLDLDAQRNRLTLGMADTDISDHILYQKARTTEFPEGAYQMGFYILFSDRDEDRTNPFGAVNRFLWEKWGAPLFQQGEPVLRGALDDYVAHTYRWAFDHWRDQVWQEFHMDGQVVGAPTFIVNVTQSPNYPDPVNEREFRSIWNQAWFNSLRSASGLYRYARRKGVDSLMHYANLTKELALAFPQQEGFFPGLVATEMEEVEINQQFYRRSKGWETRYFGNSNRNPFTTDPKEAPYHILDMSYTALLMLDWYTELDADDRLLQYARRYAEGVLEIQRPDGFFPAWIDQERLADLEVLSRSPETAMTVTFLLKLYEITDEDRYKTAALRALSSVEAEIVEQGRWEDFETYWSCSRFGQDYLGKKFPRNQMHKQNTLSIYYTAQAYMQAYKITNDARFLNQGQRVLDELLMWQAVWQPSFIHIRALGGFAVMNGDAEWNDSRQSLFAELIMEYGQALDRPDYVQRAVAAIRASFVLMYCEENQETKTQWEYRWPFLGPEDYGFMMENYGHDGLTSSQGIGIGEFTIYDWGNGAAAEAVNRMIDHWGDIF